MFERLNYNDNEPFLVNPSAFGGTEQMGVYVKNNILPGLEKFNNYRCIILPGMFNYPVWLKEDQEWIIWLHNYLDQFSDDKISFFKSPDVYKKIKLFRLIKSRICYTISNRPCKCNQTDKTLKSKTHSTMLLCTVLTKNGIKFKRF